MAQKQQVDIQRKIKLRANLLEKLGESTGACYIPFIGEGDIAVALYIDKKIMGADIDLAMVEKAKARLPGAFIIMADCDVFPFQGQDTIYSLADFDAYSYPYNSFRSFFEGAKIGSQCALVFTDGQRQAIIRTGSYITPSGDKIKLKTKTERREAYNFYFNQILLPWFKDYIQPWKIVYITKYLRAGSMCYWGALIGLPGKEHIEKANKSSESHRNKFDSIKKEQYLDNLLNGHTRGYAATLVGIHRATVSIHMKKDKAFADAVSRAESDAISKVENALFEAATSGNVTAIQVYLYNRDPKRWSDRRNIRLSGEAGGPIQVEIDAKDKLIQTLNRLSERRKEDKVQTLS